MNARFLSLIVLIFTTIHLSAQDFTYYEHLGESRSEILALEEFHVVHDSFEHGDEWLELFDPVHGAFSIFYFHEDHLERVEILAYHNRTGAEEMKNIQQHRKRYKKEKELIPENYCYGTDTAYVETCVLEHETLGRVEAQFIFPLDRHEIITVIQVVGPYIGDATREEPVN